MANPKVLIKMINSRGSMIRQELQKGLLRGVFKAGEDHWVGKREESPSLQLREAVSLGSHPVNGTCLLCKLWGWYPPRHGQAQI